MLCRNPNNTATTASGSGKTCGRPIGGFAHGPPPPAPRRQLGELSRIQSCHKLSPRLALGLDVESGRVPLAGLHAATPARSPVGARNPSSSTTERLACTWTCPASRAVVSRNNGRSPRTTRDTPDCEQPNSRTAHRPPPGTRYAASDTGSTPASGAGPAPAGDPEPAATPPPNSANTTDVSSATCSPLRPVIASHRRGGPLTIS
jgi:hypothetical protein